jgi:ribonuclease III
MDASERETDCRELEQRLGHGFVNPALLETALTHRSWSAERQQPELGENQRLEFLGDAVLGAIAAEWLVAHCPDWREGTLTKVRSRLTNEATLDRVARRLELGAHLRLGRGEEQSGGRDKRAVLADALEAVIGALWLDGGADPVRRLFQEAFAEEIAEAVEAGGDDNPKGDLQERMQQVWKANPSYVILEECGPPHERHFRVAVYRGEERLGEGEGASKREAEVHAARQALERMDTT